MNNPRFQDAMKSGIPTEEVPCKYKPGDNILVFKTFPSPENTDPETCQCKVVAVARRTGMVEVHGLGKPSQVKRGLTMWISQSRIKGKLKGLDL